MKKVYPFSEDEIRVCLLCNEEFPLTKLIQFEHYWNKHLDHPQIKSYIYDLYSKDWDKTVKGPKNKWSKFKNWFKD